MLLPRKVGPFTLMRKLDGDGTTDSFVAILDSPAGKQVVARLLAPVVTRDPARMAQIRARVADLRTAVHPSLAAVLDMMETEDGTTFVLEDQVEGVELRRVLEQCARTGRPLPHNVYLNIAAQLCNALEALHARPGIESGSENVLHLAISPSSAWITPSGRVTLCRYGLLRTPTALSTQAAGLPSRVEYLSPEQTHQDQRLTPASDLFSLGSVLYEMLTLRSMFRADTPLQTIHRVRRAEVTTQLLEVKEHLPGLDKVLFRALSLNPRHRYQRAFVLREDLRGLMAGYSFADIDQVTREVLGPLIEALPPDGDVSFDTGSVPIVPVPQSERTQELLDAVPDRRVDLSESPLDAPRVDRLELPDDDAFPDDTEALLGQLDAHRLPAPGWAGEKTLESLADVAEIPPLARQLLDDPGPPSIGGDTLPLRGSPVQPSPETDDLPTLHPDPPTADVRTEAPEPSPEPPRPPAPPEPTIPPGALAKTARMANPLAGKLAPPESLHAPGQKPPDPPPAAPIGPDVRPIPSSIPARHPARSSSTAAWGITLVAVLGFGFLLGIVLCLGGIGLFS